MKCEKCGKDFPENQIDESHDVPCYLFQGASRAEKKNQADKWGRRWLCKECHQKYETSLQEHLKPTAKIFAGVYFDNS